MEAQIRRIFKDEAKMALAISQAENGRRDCKRTHVNTNKTVDTGIFQINSIHAHKGNLSDCTENIKIAKQIYDDWGGWGAWVTYNTGAYKKFLTIN